ncbi:hypothetical protein ABIB94_009306, partial [Bradyrhizobium sp. JR7.2]
SRSILRPGVHRALRHTIPRDGRTFRVLDRAITLKERVLAKKK